MVQTGDMPGRLLRLLSLLQGRREWPAAELAERLGVTARTVRRDIARLRRLDYRVAGTTGPVGGYRLESGEHLPPLLLDDDEAVAVAVALIADTSGAVGDRTDSSRALAKLGHILPRRLRPALDALAATSVSARPPRPAVDPTSLTMLAAACRDHEVVSFQYETRRGAVAARRVEPHSLVTVHSYWYVLAFDTDRADWRSFRVDRIAGLRMAHRRFDSRQPPGENAAGYLRESFTAATYRYTATMRVALSAAEVRARLLTPDFGAIVDEPSGGCGVRVSADSLDLVAQYISTVMALGAVVTITAPPEVTRRLGGMGHRVIVDNEHG